MSMLRRVQLHYHPSTATRPANVPLNWRGVRRPIRNRIASSFDSRTFTSNRPSSMATVAPPRDTTPSPGASTTLSSHEADSEITTEATLNMTEKELDTARCDILRQQMKDKAAKIPASFAALDTQSPPASIHVCATAPWTDSGAELSRCMESLMKSLAPPPQYTARPLSTTPSSLLASSSSSASPSSSSSSTPSSSSVSGYSALQLMSSIYHSPDEDLLRRCLGFDTEGAIVWEGLDHRRGAIATVQLATDDVATVLHMAQWWRGHEAREAASTSSSRNGSSSSSISREQQQPLSSFIPPPSAPISDETSRLSVEGHLLYAHTLYTYYPRMQQSQEVIITPPPSPRYHASLTSLARVLENPLILKVGQAPFTDVTSLHKALNIYTQGVVDIEYLSRILSAGPSNLAYQTGRRLGRQLIKNQQLSDWTAHPLSKEQLEYAATDAAVCRSLLVSMLSEYCAAHSNYMHLPSTFALVEEGFEQQQQQQQHDPSYAYDIPSPSRLVQSVGSHHRRAYRQRALRLAASLRRSPATDAVRFKAAYNEFSAAVNETAEHGRRTLDAALRTHYVTQSLGSSVTPTNAETDVNGRINSVDNEAGVVDVDRKHDDIPHGDVQLPAPPLTLHQALLQTGVILGQYPSLHTHRTHLTRAQASMGEGDADSCHSTATNVNNAARLSSTLSSSVPSSSSAVLPFISPSSTTSSPTAAATWPLPASNPKDLHKVGIASAKKSKKYGAVERFYKDHGIPPEYYPHVALRCMNRPEGETARLIVPLPSCILRYARPDSVVDRLIPLPSALQSASGHSAALPQSTSCFSNVSLSHPVAHSFSSSSLSTVVSSTPASVAFLHRAQFILERHKPWMVSSPSAATGATKDDNLQSNPQQQQQQQQQQESIPSLAHSPPLRRLIPSNRSQLAHPFPAPHRAHALGMVLAHAYSLLFASPQSPTPAQLQRVHLLREDLVAAIGGGDIIPMKEALQVDIPDRKDVESFKHFRSSPLSSLASSSSPSLAESPDNSLDPFSPEADKPAAVMKQLASQANPFIKASRMETSVLSLPVPARARAHPLWSLPPPRIVLDYGTLLPSTRASDALLRANVCALVALVGEERAGDLGTGLGVSVHESSGGAPGESLLEAMYGERTAHSLMDDDVAADAASLVTTRVQHRSPHYQAPLAPHMILHNLQHLGVVEKVRFWHYDSRDTMGIEAILASAREYDNPVTSVPLPVHQISRKEVFDPPALEAPALESVRVARGQVLHPIDMQSVWVHLHGKSRPLVLSTSLEELEYLASEEAAYDVLARRALIALQIMSVI